MGMSKKDFVDLADALRPYPDQVQGPLLLDIVRFCRQQNGQFKEGRWLSYLRGECGPSGGKIKEAK